MRRKGQAAIEYISTYGWAVLIVVIAGVLMWQLGLFDLGSSITPGFSGFSIVLPQDWKLTSGGGACSLSVSFFNAAGEGLNSLSVSGGSCVPTTLPAGETSICTKIVSACNSPGDSYNEEMLVTYERDSDNQSFQSSGLLWGNID